MTNKLLEAIKDLHCEITEVIDYFTNGDEVHSKFAVTHCSECRVEWPCMTISILDDQTTLKEDGKPVRHTAQGIGKGITARLSTVSALRGGLCN